MRKEKVKNEEKEKWKKIMIKERSHFAYLSAWSILNYGLKESKE